MPKVATLLALDRLVYTLQRMNKHTEHDTREHLLATASNFACNVDSPGWG